ncbi:MAG: hypothetical protein LBT62_06305 [Deltaproteobacteria bacterium]|nr:hypothetical protein [Deltaproteobacteria bacterium]
MLSTFNTPEEESEAVAGWLAGLREADVPAREIAVFVRSEKELPRAAAVLKKAGLPFDSLDADMEVSLDKATLAVMHLAKGLEFKAVAVMACDAEAIPSRQRIEAMGDDADLEDLYATERQLLYVACTSPATT